MTKLKQKELVDRITDGKGLTKTELERLVTKMHTTLEGYGPIYSFRLENYAECFYFTQHEDGLYHFFNPYLWGS